jgi:hypothetical protein
MGLYMPEILDAPKKWYTRIATIVSAYLPDLLTLHPPLPLIGDISVQETAIFALVLHSDQTHNESGQH